MIEWTEARLKAFIQSTLRKAFSRYPPKYKVLKEACIGKRQNKATGRMAYHYKCAKCRKVFPSIDVQVDHKITAIDIEKGFTSWDDYIARLFCSSENLQVLCSNCHKQKTKGENEIRRTSRKNRKQNLQRPK